MNLINDDNITQNPLAETEKEVGNAKLIITLSINV
jgi:hypothetical protein